MVSCGRGLGHACPHGHARPGLSRGRLGHPHHPALP